MARFYSQIYKLMLFEWNYKKNDIQKSKIRKFQLEKYHLLDNRKGITEIEIV
jgi:hypothetical protein